MYISYNKAEVVDSSFVVVYIFPIWICFLSFAVSISIARDKILDVAKNVPLGICFSI